MTIKGEIRIVVGLSLRCVSALAQARKGLVQFSGYERFLCSVFVSFRVRFIAIWLVITDGHWPLGSLINSDTLHWMKDSGLWWYDKNVASGETLPEIPVISFMRYFYSCGLSKIYKAYSVGSHRQNKMAHSSGRFERVDYVALYNLSSVNLEPPLKKGNNN